MRSTPIFLFVFLVLFSGSIFAQTDGWNLVKNEDGIKIFSRRASEERALKELKVVAEVKGNLSSFLVIFSDKSNFPKWVYSCGSAKMLKVVSENETYHYQTTDMPWPLQNRDLILHTKLNQDPATNILTIDCKAAPTYLTINKDFIRINSYKAHWILTPKPEGVFEIVYTVNFDPEGGLPDWMINLASAEGPLKTIKNLREMLAAYQNSKLSTIKN